MTEIVFPNTYDEWLYLMDANAKEVLSKESIQRRIKVLTNADDPETKQFCKLYGEGHRQKVIQWFKRAAQEMN